MDLEYNKLCHILKKKKKKLKNLLQIKTKNYINAVWKFYKNNFFDNNINYLILIFYY